MALLTDAENVDLVPEMLPPAEPNVEQGNSAAGGRGKRNKVAKGFWRHHDKDDWNDDSLLPIVDSFDGYRWLESVLCRQIFGSHQTRVGFQQIRGHVYTLHFLLTETQDSNNALLKSCRMALAYLISRIRCNNIHIGILLHLLEEIR